MVCPSCNAEFPHGTVFCPRCHVTLLRDLAEADDTAEKAYPGSALVHLWRGADAARHASLLAALKQTGIIFYAQPLGSGPSARPIDRLLEHAHPRFGFGVAVLSSNLAEAEIILERLLREDPVDMALAAHMPASRQRSRAENLPRAWRRVKCGPAMMKLSQVSWKRRYESTGFRCEGRATARKRLWMHRPKTSSAPGRLSRRSSKASRQSEQGEM
jgi:hypothetical protein